MATGKAISFFLIDGMPDGRVAGELYNWTGKCYRLPRNRLKDSADREDLHKAGLYFLFGRDEESPDVSVAYIGEAEEVYSRLMQQQDQDFWNQALVFISKDENLNKAHVKFLESAAVMSAIAAGRFRLKNGNTPPSPAMSESEQAVMSEFFTNLKLLTGSMGFRIFEPLTEPAGAADEKYYIKSASRGADASAVWTADGLVVQQSARAAKSVTKGANDSVRRVRDRLLNQGVLRESDGELVFTRDYLFPSPSSAACVVLGRNASGLTEWKDARNRTLKENEGGGEPAAAPAVEEAESNPFG